MYLDTFNLLAFVSGVVLAAIILQALS